MTTDINSGQKNEKKLNLQSAVCSLRFHPTACTVFNFSRCACARNQIRQTTSEMEEKLRFHAADEVMGYGRLGRDLNREEPNYSVIAFKW